MLKNTVRQILCTWLRNDSASLWRDSPYNADRVRYLDGLEALNLVALVELPGSRSVSVLVNESAKKEFFQAYNGLPRELGDRAFGNAVFWKIYVQHPYGDVSSTRLAEWLLDDGLPCRAFPSAVYFWYPMIDDDWIENVMGRFTPLEFQAKALKPDLEDTVLKLYGEQALQTLNKREKV